VCGFCFAFSYSIQQLQDTNKCLVHKNFEFHRGYLPRLSAEDIRHRGYLPRISAEDIPTTLTNVPITKIQLKERNQYKERYKYLPLA
jgi:hypothetical protein